MRKNYQLNFLLIVVFIGGCNSNSIPFDTEADWRLAWRVWESAILDQDFVIGAKQFDSLIQKVHNPPMPIMSAGINCFAETRQYTKAYEILRNYDLVQQLDLCSLPWFLPPPTKEWGELCTIMKPSEVVTLPQVRESLIVMYINDQFARRTGLETLVQETGYRITTEELYRVDVEKTDKINIEKLKIIFDEIGFPDRKMVGTLGMHSIYTIISNANQDPEFQESQLPNLWRVAQRGEVRPEDCAYLADQIEINKGNSPIYGTHFSPEDIVEGRAILVPAMDEAIANKNRFQKGLMPLELLKRWRLFSLEQFERATSSN